MKLVFNKFYFWHRGCLKSQKLSVCPPRRIVEDWQIRWLAIPLGLKSHFDRLSVT